MWQKLPERWGKRRLTVDVIGKAELYRNLLIFPDIPKTDPPSLQMIV